MKKLATGLGVILGGLIGIQALYAEEKKEEYVVEAKKDTLIEKPLAGAEGKQITINRFTLPPGHVGGKHYHSGPVFVYILEGSFSVEEEGKGNKTFEAGNVYEEPIGSPMQARNLSASEPVKLLVIQVHDEGEPLMYKAE